MIRVMLPCLWRVIGRMEPNKRLLLLCGQVRNVLQLYVDIEHTSRSNAFYEKYNLRYSMGELLRARLLATLPSASAGRTCLAGWQGLPSDAVCAKRNVPP